MACLASVSYAPTTSVNKVTTAALAMTTLDTTNLRLTFTVPASGRVWVLLRGTLHGAATFPQILLGIRNGTTNVWSEPPMVMPSNAAATTLARATSTGVIGGLTPSASLTWDAAYGVETLVAATGLKYGGPDNATANDNFGPFVFEVWEA